MRDRSDGLLLVRGWYRPRRQKGVAASLRHVLIVDGAVLTPILMQEIKFKFEFILLTVLVPGCRGNYVPLGFQSQPTATHPPVELLATRALPAKNKLRFN